MSALSAKGGDVSLVAGKRLVASKSVVTAESGSNGGNIKLRAGELIQLTDSTITARAGTNGGRVTIDPPVLALKNSTIDARAGGKPVVVQIDTSGFLSSQSRILTNAGTLFPETDIAGSLLALHPDLIEGQATLEPRCGEKFDRLLSSFVVTGRGGEPPVPGAWIPDLRLNGLLEQGTNELIRRK